MAYDKLYTAKQAAFAVLQKTQELLEKSELLKKEHHHIGWGKLHGKLEREGHSAESADKIAGAIKAKVHPMGKSEEIKAKLIKEGLSPNEVRSRLAKYEDENAKKENAKPSEHDSKDAEQHAEGVAPKGEIHPKEHVEGAAGGPKEDTQTQPSPQHNPKEQAEGNNELAGTTPNQVGQDGKAIPGGDEIKGHLKLAKFIGHMEARRKMKKGM